jgi:hypothetical protein
MWLWIGIGLGAFFGLSILVGLAVAAMLGAISRGVTELHEEIFEAGPCAVEPPTKRRRHRPRRRRRDEVAARVLGELEPHA